MLLNQDGSTPTPILPGHSKSVGYFSFLQGPGRAHLHGVGRREASCGAQDSPSTIKSRPTRMLQHPSQRAPKEALAAAETSDTEGLMDLFSF